MPSDHTQPAVTVEHLCKRFYLQGGRAREVKTAILAAPAALFNGRGREAFWALQDVSFTVGRGESLGIVGRNGSGKSTLLRIVAGISPATSGNVTIQGRASAVLELGSGFHPQISGRENALLNAVLLGLSLREAREALPSIIAFSELGEFIDQPMRTYSSGMFVRLGFAVAVHVRPEILLIDEVLSVGDAEFQSKCFAHMEQLRQAGVTTIIASHDLPSVQRYTDRVILLERGQITMEGKPADVLHEYLARALTPAGEK